MAPDTLRAGTLTRGTTSRSMALGLVHQMWAIPELDDADFVRHAIEEIQLADALGFDSVWIGEHHLANPTGRFYGRISASEIFLSHVAAKTKRIHLGTGVRVLPTTSAQRAAEEMATLDLLAEGRMEFGVGQGYTREGETKEDKTRRFRSLLGELLALLDHDPPEGTARLSPTPSPTIKERLWVAARDDESITFAAEHDLNFVVGQAELASRQAPFVRRYREAGGIGEARGVRIAFVASTKGEAEALSEDAVRRYFAVMSQAEYHREAIAEGGADDPAPSLAGMREQMSFLVGDPETVAEGLLDYVEETAVDRLDVMAQVPGLATAAVRRSLELLNNEVRPRLARAWTIPAAEEQTA